MASGGILLGQDGKARLDSSGKAVICGGCCDNDGTLKVVFSGIDASACGCHLAKTSPGNRWGTHTGAFQCIPAIDNHISVDGTYTGIPWTSELSQDCQYNKTFVIGDSLSHFETFSDSGCTTDCLSGAHTTIIILVKLAKFTGQVSSIIATLLGGALLDTQTVFERTTDFDLNVASANENAVCGAQNIAADGGTVTVTFE